MEMFKIIFAEAGLAHIFILSTLPALIYQAIINIYAALKLPVPKGLTLRRIEPFDWYWNNLHTDSLSERTDPYQHCSAIQMRQHREDTESSAAPEQGKNALYPVIAGRMIWKKASDACRDLYPGQDSGRRELRGRSWKEAAAGLRGGERWGEAWDGGNIQRRQKRAL